MALYEHMGDKDYLKILTEQEEVVTEAGVAGNLVGMVLILGPQHWAIWRGIAAALSDAHRKCGVFKISNQRDCCLAKVRYAMAMKQIAFLKRTISSECKNQKNPEKCKKGLISQVRKFEKEAAKQKAKVSKLSVKGKCGEEPATSTKFV